MSIMQYDLGQGTEKNWLVAEKAFDDLHLGKGEAIFCQGNGYLGQRAALEERYVGQTRNLFVTGTFHAFDQTEVTELPNLPDLTNLSLSINGTRFSLETGSVIDYIRFLNLKTGELVRFVSWESPVGDVVRLTFRRFVSLVNDHLLGAKVEITALSGDIALQLESGIDGRVSNSGSQHFLEGDKRIYNNTVLEMLSPAKDSPMICCLHTAHRFALDGQPYTPELLPVIDRRYMSSRAELALAKGQTLTVEKLSCVHTSRDQACECNEEAIHACLQASGKAFIAEALSAGYDALFEASRTAWASLWQSADIRIDSARDYDQLAIRFALYHMNIMVKKDDPRVGIGAKGMSGEGYKGHSFWDTEIFLLPYYTLTQPQTAKTLVTYRYLGLLGALRKAAENGFEGAMYPWEAAWMDDGEVTPLWGAADVVTGLPMKILTGILEQHITGDVAFGIWQYYTATGDQAFMDACGYEVMIETARFWASRVTWDEAKQAYVILDVIGPDEYKEHVNNNAYTNYMAHYNLRLALTVLDRLEAERGEVYERLSKTIPFDQARTRIQAAAYKLYLPKPDSEGIVPQFEGYFDLTHIDLAKYKGSSVVGTIYNDYNIEQISAFQVSKQADLLVLLFLMDDLFSVNIKRKNFMFYEERTLHDSSLSKSTHCVLACDLGLSDAARTFFHGACDTDLGPVMTTSDMGIHSASMGGIWQSVVYGFGGVRVVGRELRIAPRLLPEWQMLAFPLYWQCQPLTVTADQQGVTLTPHGDVPVTVRVYGELYELCPDQSLHVVNSAEA